MEQISLKVNKRDIGKKAVKDYRRDDKVVGVFYINGEDSIPIIAETLAMRPIIYTKETHIINLEIEGENKVRECVLKEVTFDPVTDKIKHFDLIGLSLNLMNFEVPVLLVGSPVGVRDGGVLQQNVHKLKVRCLAKDLPDHFTLDITNLELGKSIYVHDIKVENVEIEAAGDTPIISCSHSRISKSEAGTPEAAAAPEKKAE